MYESFFGFKQRPFLSTARPERYHANAAAENVRASLLRCVERSEGVATLIAAAGLGKSMMCRQVAALLATKFQVALIVGGQIGSPRMLYQALLYELSQPFRGLDEGELRLSLLGYLENSKLPLAMIVDEAQAVSPRVLEELRALCAMLGGTEAQPRLILAGSTLLEERLTHPKLAPLSQRIAVRAYLDRLPRAEVADFVRAELAQSGANPGSVFAEDAYDAVYRASDGIPRLINQVCDHALLLARAAGQHTVNAAIVQEAWADLQQLPMPATTNPAAAAMSVIEFATLADPEDLPSSIPFPGAVGSVSSRLDEVESHIARLADDFRPLGAPAPEVELVFDPNWNPFGEQFVEEEVLADPFVGAPAAVAPVPAVAARSTIATPAEVPAAPQKSPPSPKLEAPQFPTTDRMIDSSYECQIAIAQAPSAAFYVSQTVAGPATLPNVTVDVVLPDKDFSLLESDAGTVRVNRKEPIDVVEPEEPELIVVEDERAPVVRTPSQRVIRHGEFRRLFATMKRG